MTISSHHNLLAWGSDIEDATLQQAEKCGRLPFVQGHVALMPDAHVGMGTTVGMVIPTKGAIIPAAIGTDIGCGMMAVETDVDAGWLPDDLSSLHEAIERAVPAGVGAGHSGHRVLDTALITIPMRFSQKEGTTALNQLGSLGSGNHFVEVCLDERDKVWIILHSGSRGIGNQLATKHIECAKGLMKRYFIDLEDPNLAYLVEGTHEFEAYINDMLWAQDYAQANREMMMRAIVPLFWDFLSVDGKVVSTINCHHNFTELENHHGKNMWITRKGAIRAREGDRGIIPGSMGTNSYIVSGLGNSASYCSSSHGAGRVLSRGAARRALSVYSLTEAMEGKAWNSGNAEDLLDEHPRAYKDIDQVMKDQSDLTAIDHTLTQVLNYKGIDTRARKRRF